MTEQRTPLQIQVLSDLHLNNKGWQAPHAPADLVVLAGDIANGTAGLQWARQNFEDTPIVYISGNQEYYGHNADELLAEMHLMARELDIHFLEEEVITFKGLRILGATLWTDFNLFGFEARWLAITNQRANAPLERKDILSNDGVVTPHRKIMWHDRTVAWLTEELNQEFDGKTMVVTHHVPTIRGVPKQYLDDLSSAAFASNLDHLFPLVDVWVCGHTHTASDFQVGRCRVVINPRGRTLDGRNGFDPELVIEV